MPPLTAQSSERFSCTSAPSSTASGCGSYHAFHAPPPVSSSSSRTAAGMSGAAGMRSARASRSACSSAIQTARMALESERASGGRLGLARFVAGGSGMVRPSAELMESRVPAAARDVAVALGRVRWATDCAGAVSYTHLTLPTKA